MNENTKNGTRNTKKDGLRTESISFLKKNAAHLPVDGSPIVITQNGVPKYVVESFEDFSRRNEVIGLIKNLASAKNDVKQGNVRPVSELRKDLSKRKEEVAE